MIKGSKQTKTIYYIPINQIYEVISEMLKEEQTFSMVRICYNLILEFDYIRISPLTYVNKI